MLLLLCLLGYNYKNWDTYSSIKSNIVELSSNLYSVIKTIKDSILDSIRKLRNNRNESSNNSSDESKDKSFSESNNEIDSTFVDIRIISYPYKYTFLKIVII